VTRGSEDLAYAQQYPEASELREVNIDGAIWSRFLEQGLVPAVSYSIVSDDRTLTFSSFQSDEPLLNQILSTFRLIE